MAGAAALVPVAHGRIMYLGEVLAAAAALDGCSLRVMGRVESVDVVAGDVVIRQRGAALCVHVALLGSLALPAGALFQFIGELECRPGAHNGQPVLQARVARDVSGLDERLWDEALALRRKFEAQHLPPAPHPPTPQIISC
eukprot:SM000166S02480  [mRNA]  locus=s166:64511:65627:- [translate_table: standard]